MSVIQAPINNFYTKYVTCSFVSSVFTVYDSVVICFCYNDDTGSTRE